MKSSWKKCFEAGLMHANSKNSSEAKSLNDDVPRGKDNIPELYLENVNKCVPKYNQVYPGTERQYFKSRRAPKITDIAVNNVLKKSSIYAFSQIGNAKTQSRKIVWILVLLVGSFGCGYQINNFFTIYFTYPVIVSLQEEHNWELYFPAVTVCNLNRMKVMYRNCEKFDTLYGECYMSVLNDDRYKFEMSISERRNALSCSDSLNGTIEYEKIDFLTKYMNKGNEHRRFVGHEKSELIRHCTFNMRACSSDDFIFFQSLRYGNCYTFNRADRNGTEALKTSLTGYSSGLELLLNVDLKEYMSVSPSIGIRVSIHDPEEAPNPDDMGVDISPGFETSIAVEQTIIKRQPAPFRDHCMDYRSRHDQKNKEECMKACLQERSLGICGCIDPTITTMLDGIHCNMTDRKDICCLDNVQDHIVKHGPPCDCPLSCVSTFYDELLSKAIWPSEAALSINERNNENITYMRENHALLKIFYSSLVRTVYKQLPMFEESEIFSHLGGELALWLGLSLFALFELVEAFINFCNYLKKYFTTK